MRIQSADFSVEQLQSELIGASQSEGAIATFTGLVRNRNTDRDIQRMTLEHYPGMTERSIESIMRETAKRWPILRTLVVHRVGELVPGDRIVWVGVSAAHREAAFSACEFIMDFLKTRAPLWKKESSPSGEHWVEARTVDAERAARWSR